MKTFTEFNHILENMRCDFCKTLKVYLKIKQTAIVRGFLTQKHLLILLFLLIIAFVPNSYLKLAFAVFLNLIFYSNKNDFQILIHFFHKRLLIVILLSEFIIYNIFVFFLGKVYLLELWQIFAYITLSVLIFLNSINEKRLKKISIKINFIPNILFEIKSFFRAKNYFFIFFVFSLFLLYTDFFFYFLYSLFIMEFFAQAFTVIEPKELTIGFFKKFSLKSKIYVNVAFLLMIFILPSLLLSFHIYPDYWLISIYIMFYTIIYCTLILLHKYNNLSTIGTKSYISIPLYLFYFFISVSLLLGIFISIKMFIKSNNNIKVYVGS